MGSSHNQISVSLGWWLFPWARTDSISLIVSKSYGQLGNQIVENACSIAVAKRFGIKEVIPESSYPFREGIHNVAGVTFRPGVGTIEKVTNSNILISFLRGLKPEVHLRGAFFLSWHEMAGKNHPQPSRRIFRDLAKAMSFDLGGNPLPEGQVVAHIRGGDIFDQPVNPHYGQPPLSFYQLVLTSRKWEKVWVVSQDSANPVFEALLTWLKQSDINYEVQSKSVAEDGSLIYGSKNVIASRGTFTTAITAMSPESPSVWFFGDEKSPADFRNLKRVLDGAGLFEETVLANRWAATAEQLNLLVSYPASNLLVPDS